MLEHDYSKTRSGQDPGNSDPKMRRATSSSQDACTHQIWDSYLKLNEKHAPDMNILKTRSEVMVTVTRKWYVTLSYPKMCSYTKFGIPISKNI